jgi:hypothetical protein
MHDCLFLYCAGWSGDKAPTEEKAVTGVEGLVSFAEERQSWAEKQGRGSIFPQPFAVYLNIPFS